MIRNADGSMHATVRRPEACDGEFDTHRVEGTDPFAELASKIIFYDDLVAENASLRLLVSGAEQREKDARSLALEDAAKVAETHQRKIWRYWDDPDEIPELKRIPFQEDIAAAIRALQPE